MIKDFDRLPELDSTPACEFKLGNKTWHVKNASSVPLHLIEPALTGEIHTTIGAFFEAIIVSAEADEFLELIRSPRSPLTAGNVVPLMQWITECLVKRPTKRPASSRGGSRSTAQKSAGRSSSRVTPKLR